MSTGSEATENCIKLAKTYALEKHGPHKKYFVTFHYAFHGRTMGAQLAGGIDKQKEWMVDRDPTFVQVPFPDGYKNEDTSFDLFLKTLKDKGVQPRDIAGVMTETYQGGGPDFLPVDYAQKLRSVLPRARHCDVLRRSAGGLRPHRQDVRLRALRRPARPDRLRQGHLLVAAHLRRDRPRRHHGSLCPRLDDLHALGVSPAGGRRHCQPGDHPEGTPRRARGAPG